MKSLNNTKNTPRLRSCASIEMALTDVKCCRKRICRVWAMNYRCISLKRLMSVQEQLRSPTRPPQDREHLQEPCEQHVQMRADSG